MAKRPEQSLDVVGQSLLSQQATRRDKENKKARRREKKMMLMGALVAGQSLVTSALDRRVKEITENNELAMQNAKLYHKQYKKAAQLYGTFDGYNFQNAEEALANPSYTNKFDSLYTPIFDRQLKAELDSESLPYTSTERQQLFAKRRQRVVTDLFNNKTDWEQGISTFGLNNKELAFGSEADTNIQLTKLAKKEARNLSGSIFNWDNAKVFGSFGLSKKDSAFDKSSGEFAPLTGMQKVVQSLGLDESFIQMATEFRNTGRDWKNLAVYDGATQTLIKNARTELYSDLKNRSSIVKTNRNLQPFDKDKVVKRKVLWGENEHIHGTERYREYLAWLEKDGNANIEGQITKDTTAYFLKLKHERGAKQEVLDNSGLTGDELEELKITLNNDSILLKYANIFVLKEGLTDHQEGEYSALEWQDDFSYDSTNIRKHIAPFIKVEKTGFETTPDFTTGTDADKTKAEIDAKVDILGNKDLDGTTKVAVIEELDKSLKGKTKNSSKVTTAAAYERLNIDYNLDLTEEDLKDLAKIRQQRIKSKETAEDLQRKYRKAWNVTLISGDMDALTKFAETGNPETTYQGSDRFYSALERAGLPRNATQEMVRKYLES